MNQKGKGFTLVEMIVTLAVLTILLSVSVFGLIAWQENARFTQQNEYAQTLFAAAQNQLSEYSRNGVLENFQGKITNVGGSYDRVLDVTNLTDGEGNPYTKEQVWYESYEKGTESSKYQGEICYVSCNAGDYEQYKNGTLGSAAKSRGADVLFELLSNYVYDQSILNNSISVEFSPEEGQVFAVCFSDGGLEFVYEAPTVTASAGSVNISNREESYRKTYMVGYYGVDTLARSTTVGNKKPVLTSVKLNNEETLNLSFKAMKVAGAAQQLMYNLNVYDKDTKNLILGIDIDGSMIHNYETRAAVPCDVTRYVYASDGEQTAQNLGSYDILSWIDEDETVRIVLDAVDIQATSFSYISDLKAGNAGLKSEGAGATDFASTYSFHRFGVDADNIYCTIQGSGANYKTTATKQSNWEAACFATTTVSKAKDTETSLTTYDYTYTIKNGRHLYNVRFVEDMTASEQNTYSDTLESSLITNRFEVTENIDWGEFAASGNVYYTKTGIVNMTDVANAEVNQLQGADGTLCARTLLACDFPSVKQLRYGDVFSGNSENGKASDNKEITNLSISETSNVIYGLYTISDGSSLSISSVLSADTASAETASTYTEQLDEDRPVGLFINNFGSISMLSLDSITVSGSKKVGAFCGENGGSLENLEVKSSDEENPSTVTGLENVGGIIGYQKSINDASVNDGVAQTPVISNLTNRAKVTGMMYVGGIVGEIYIPNNSEQPAVTIDSCKNYGAITACNSEELTGQTSEEAKTEPRYIGGIVGYCHNEYTDENNQIDMEHLKVFGCVSSPEYSEEDLDLFLERSAGNDDSIDQVTNGSYKGENLRGVYVGGIVGYNYFGTIENCSAQAESGKTGYIFGYKYVGGIVGFNQGPASGIKGGTGDSDKGVNENNVVGYQYVGGISGCNSNIMYKDGTEEPDLDSYDVIQPDPETNLNVKISNWENRGVIFALDSYAGGITGYNSGWLYDCDSRVSNSQTNGFFQETYSGDYAGGISGYNNGTIGKTDRVILADGSSGSIISKYTGEATTVCYITGRNYVGGIVGYNDVDAVVEDYGLAGGRIKGSGSFVGGYAGLNASLNLLMDDDGNAHKIVSKPNEVSGKYFVGGNIGGNIVDCTGTATKTVYANFETNNFFGKITSEAFAGGFVGYNLLLTGKSKEEIFKLQKDILDEFEAIEEKTGKYAGYTPDSYLGDLSASEVSADVLRMTEKVEYLDKLSTQKASVNMQISGDEDSKTKNRLGKISGKVCLGGVVGYNDKNTELYVKNVVNTTPIEATMAIPNAKEQKERNVREYDGVTDFTYSYAGGIIGKVNERVTLYKCENGAGANVTTQGTYTGGLTEVNEGTISYCNVSSIGAATDDYIGGICGLNKKKGTISCCQLADVSISGRNYVGGIVAENFGLVENSVIQNANNKDLVNTTVSAVGIDVSAGGEQILDDAEIVTEKQGIVGCVAAYNAGTISQNTDLVDIKVISGGNYAGAIVGVNDGNVINSKTDSKIRVTGSVSGQEYVGGVIGINKGTTTTADSSNNQVSGYRNEATVTAEQGNAGGILGNNASGTDICDCENAGEVIARQSGAAGGITAENHANIINCTDYGEVSSPNGDCGGIAAWNYKGAKIENCKVISPDEDSKLEFTARDTVGGITSYNEGSVINPQLTNVYVYNYTNSPVSNIGVVAGVNYKTGKIILGTGDNADDQKVDAVVGCVAETYINNSNVGGVAGINYGIITASEWYQAVSLGEGKEDTESRTFDVPRAWVSCSVGYKNDGVSFGNLGGVSGKNEGIIENIGVKSSQIIGSLGSTTTGVGGVCGVSVPAETNEDAVTKTPKINNCTFDGTVKAAGTYANTIYLGGIVGLNQEGSSIYGCRIGVSEETTISNGGSADTSQYGYVGGIAGTTYGDIKSCDSYHTDGTTVKVLIETNAGQVGGVVGLQQDGARVTGEQNRRLSTGKDWTISYYRYINDHAIGGIVGSSYSNEYYEYVSNYATALYVGEAPSGTHYNKASGGILGRLWPASTKSVHFTYCYNYGDVLGKKKANGTDYTNQGRFGGIIGQLQYAGVTMEGCKNYGTLRGGHYTGGMIGCVYSALTDIEVLDCQNHGNLYGQTAAAGMIANRYHGNGTSCDFIFYKCVNTGLTGSSDNTTSRSGMGTVMAGAGGSAVTGYYAQCQNYGYGISGSNFSGIQNGIAVNSIFNCFDMSGGSFSAASASKYSGNYFVNRDSFTKTDTATGNSSSTRLNYSNGALYIGSTITSVQNLTTLSNGESGSSAYFNEKSTSYILGGTDSVQNIRYRTYLEMSQPVSKYIESTYCVKNISGKDKLDSISGLKLNYRNNAGYETLTWNKVSQAYSYEVEYTVTKSNGKTVTKTEEIEGLCRLHIENDELTDATNLHVKIRAKDGCGNESHYSEWTETDLVPKEILPTPKYHFEMVYYDLDGTTKCTEGRMIAVLDNASDYIRNGVKIADVKITNAGNWTIDPVKGYTATVQTLGRGQKQTRAYAVPTSAYSNKYVQSPTSANVTYIAGTDVMYTEYNTVKFSGFYGDTTSNLSYKITISTNKIDSTVFSGFYTQEVMAYDDEVGALISYAHGYARKDMTGDNTLTLSGFPTDLTSREKIIVKNIFWSAQGNSVYYGHTVAEKISLEQLKVLTDDKFYYLTKNENGQLTGASVKSQSIWSDGKLNDGYIIYKNADGTYSVYYSALYAGQQKLELAKGETVNTVGGLTQMVYTRSGKDEDNTAAYTDLSGNKISVQPKPVIADLTQDDAGNYVFTWDVDKDESSYGNAEYDVEITGTTVDGKTVSFKLKDSVVKWDKEKKLATYSITPEGNWNYKSLTLSVSRRGDVDSSNNVNKTISFPSGAEKEFKIKISFEQIGVPNVDHDGDRNRLLYNIQWNGVSTSAEKNDLGGYLITVTSRETEPGDKTATHYYYVLENKNDTPDTIQKLIDKADESGVKVTNVTNKYDKSESILSTVIDLDDFQSEEKIEVSVKAIAKNGAEVYKDGPEGRPQSPQLPTRLTVPDVLKLSATYKGTVTNGVALVSELDKGITIKYSDSSNKTDLAGLYIAVAVYDSNETVSGNWNDGAVETLVDKDSNTKMGGNLSSAYYDLKLPNGKVLSDYAGKWLKVAIRSCADNAISSSWTDDYMWIQIPTAQLDDVNLADAAATKWAFNNESWTKVTSGIKYITTRTLTFKAKEQAEGYNISIVDQNNAVHWIYVTKNGDSYDISYAQTGSSISASGIYAKSKDNVYTQKVGSIKNGDDLNLPYVYSALNIIDGGISTSGADLPATLSLSADGETFTLSLPDVTGYCINGTDVKNAAYLKTSQVSVQAIVYDKTDNAGNLLESGYKDSKIDIWNVNNSGTTETKSVDEKAAAPTISGKLTVVNDSNEFKITYSGGAGTALLTQILATDESDNLLEVRYDIGEITIPKTSFSYTKSDGKTAERKIQIRFAEITSGGISKWTSWYALSADGSLTEINDATVHADTIATDTISGIWENQSEDTESTTTELPAAEGSITEVPATEQTTESTETESMTTESVTTEENTKESVTNERSTTEKSVTESISTESTTEDVRTEEKGTETTVTETSE